MKAPALTVVFVTLGDETVHPVEVKPPPRCRAEIVELDDERHFVRGEAYFAAELRLKIGPSPVYRGEEPPTPKGKELSSKKRKLSPSIVLTGKMKKKTATRSESSEKIEKRGAEIEVLGIKRDEEKATVLNKEVETKSIQEAGTKS